MRHRAIAIGAGLAMAVLVLAGTAEARNPNCAGGIQYLVQALRDKDKGNLEDYRREIFKAVDRLLTNFHLPQSTLLLLVSAFAGRELILRAYAEAVKERYRFYSYGDCMLIL